MVNNITDLVNASSQRDESLVEDILRSLAITEYRFTIMLLKLLTMMERVDSIAEEACRPISETSGEVVSGLAMKECDIKEWKKTNEMV